jgi:Fic family protein
MAIDSEEGWRDDADGPMQVVSGRMSQGKHTVHFQAPPAARINQAMGTFLRWFNAPTTCDPFIKAGLAHLWFLTIHPFGDGNGRIARAINDMALARAHGTGQRFYSFSAQLQREKGDYYAMLELTQKGELDVTRWLGWFLGCLKRACGCVD